MFSNIKNGIKYKLYNVKITSVFLGCVGVHSRSKQSKEVEPKLLLNFILKLFLSVNKPYKMIFNF